jgi:putative DNA primase/helicase
LVTLAAGGNEENDQRLAEARSTTDRLAHGEAIFGYTKLAQLVGAPVATQASSWLDLAASPAPSPVATDQTEVELSEDGVAQLFADRHSGVVSFDHKRGQWFEWTGDRWKQDGTGHVYSRLRSLVREVTDDAKPRVRKAARRSGFINGVERLAQRDQAVAVEPDVWDAEPMLLGTPGLTVDLRSGAGYVPVPADRITKHTAIRPADRADCPRWLPFLDEATGGDAEMIRFLQQWCGYCLTGDTREHALLFIYGPGGNGKSVFLSTIAGILGDYAETADMDTFVEAKYARHPTDLAKLRGARLMSASETEEGARLGQEPHQAGDRG